MSLLIPWTLSSMTVLPGGKQEISGGWRANQLGGLDKGSGAGRGILFPS